MGSSAASGIGTPLRSRPSRFGKHLRNSFPLFRAAAARALATSQGSCSVTLTFEGGPPVPDGCCEASDRAVSMPVNPLTADSRAELGTCAVRCEGMGCEG